MDRLPADLAGRPIIIGGGLAGLITALDLAPEKMILLAKTPLAEGAASTWAQGGVAAALGREDAPALHAADTLAAGDGLADPAIAARITAAVPAAIAELERRGGVFDRDAAADAGPIRVFLAEAVGVVRARSGIEAAIARLEALAFADEPAADPAAVALLNTTAALRREESRGGHWRRDFPHPA
jgi:aspartate oxidase